MGFTTVTVSIANPANGKQSQQIDLLVDTGALYTVIRSSVLKKLHVKPFEKRHFTLANGQRIIREIGGLKYQIGRYQGVAPVIFGRAADKDLLGVTALEALGLTVDPISKQLTPSELLLLHVSC